MPPLTPGQKKEKLARAEWRDLAGESNAIVVVADPASMPQIEIDDERSLINLLPDYIQDKVLKLPIELFELEIKQLEKSAFGAGSPASSYRKLRICFWEEYEHTQKHKLPAIDMDVVFRKSCGAGYFKQNVLQNDARLAWLMTPPAEYTVSLKEVSELGLERMKEALELEVDKDKPNTKLIEVQLKIFQHADQRLKGAIVQRIEQRALNMNVNANASPELVNAAEQVTKMSMEQIEAEIARFEGRSRAAEIPGTVHVDLMKDVQARKVTRPEEAKSEQASKEELSEAPADQDRS